MARNRGTGRKKLINGEQYQDHQLSPERSFGEHKTQLALAVAEHIALALSNLKLRETLRQ